MALIKNVLVLIFSSFSELIIWRKSCPGRKLILRRIGRLIYSPVTVFFEILALYLIILNDPNPRKITRPSMFKFSTIESINAEKYNSPFFYLYSSPCDNLYTSSALVIILLLKLAISDNFYNKI
jgi:hypothetical protein